MRQYEYEYSAARTAPDPQSAIPDLRAEGFVKICGNPKQQLDKNPLGRAQDLQLWNSSSLYAMMLGSKEGENITYGDGIPDDRRQYTVYGLRRGMMVQCESRIADQPEDHGSWGSTNTYAEMRIIQSSRKTFRPLLKGKKRD
ncbi:hypothetical protein TREMEDRAFT_66170 [Tremella mesenterica DSM 1558]|uniref:uncharacterized protein n=1 Tax=Tremella mesenterica (strain ATCC 24925 / CBS 8224 / DSM 1558 / NBRC 9311 / NRRL Y-6157 / RJB 2259-6 / UBC 559-6) TaxID=578456 RepID=UPI00032BFF61|nr:uncharacterized protein TREMEDRAFT_66170 [Tremella mesenterica DSM 1558]EIW65801.1 hypothetical protein TREMEDRAFT_66170 [Tremella mesenterica DSM 1558]